MSKLTIELVPLKQTGSKLSAVEFERIREIINGNDDIALVRLSTYDTSKGQRIELKPLANIGSRLNLDSNGFNLLHDLTGDSTHFCSFQALGKLMQMRYRNPAFQTMEIGIGNNQSGPTENYCILVTDTISNRGLTGKNLFVLQDEKDYTQKGHVTALIDEIGIFENFNDNPIAPAYSVTQEQYNNHQFQIEINEDYPNVDQYEYRLGATYFSGGFPVITWDEPKDVTDFLTTDPDFPTPKETVQIRVKAINGNEPSDWSQASIF